jgi:hypothetical protein
MSKNLRDFIEDKLQNATLQWSPFPYLIIENFLPNDVYASVLRYNPFQDNEGVEWISKKHSARLKTSTPYEKRKQVNLHADQKYHASPEASAFWDDMKSTFLGDAWFARTIARIFPEYFLVRFGEALTHETFWERMQQQLFLQRHEPGYHIGPHTDTPTRVLTCIFSFSDRSGFDEFGTQLARHKDPFVRCWGNDHHGFDEFEVVKTAPYKPNNFLLFLKTRQSFHAVKLITPEVPNQRYGMQFQLYEPPGGVFRDLSNPDLFAFSHEGRLLRLAKTIKRRLSR